ncbi:hypothetical protein [Pseudoflavonifractor phocaeensis]|uniref:hypothetical protein n=1 Tax=Pseudoflavonifractor phocaeensis TaxID=1870988 RepID=UPI00195B10A4|nr:hypothetical protein [Pseudoflavonifractor phocaeensis]MBM6927106.1 hypothetical protein [Pseudoflavonifractor phocaeensis]
MSKTNKAAGYKAGTAKVVEISADMIHTMTHIIGLSLTAEREEYLIPNVQGWISGANEINELMQKPEFAEISPVDVYRFD